MSGNVLDYIAKGVNSNYGESFSTGYNQGAKRKLAQQEQNALEQYRQQNLAQQASENAGLMDYRNRSLAQQAEEAKARIALGREQMNHRDINPMDQRIENAARIHLLPGSPEYMDYVLTGGYTSGGGKGGSVSGEILGRIGMGERFLSRVPDIEKRIDAVYGPKGQGLAENLASRVKQYAGYGEGTAIANDISSGSDALVRMLTGAGMHEQEAQAYAKRYNLTPGATYEQMKQRFGNLRGDLRASIDAIKAGKNITSADLPGNGGGDVGYGGSVGGQTVSPRAEAEAAIARTPAAREEIIKKAKALNIDTTGL